MAYPTYTDPTEEQARADPSYTTQVGAIDQQAGLNEQTYAQRRMDTINSYQSALDSINIGLKGAGIQSRAQYAGRQLYDASGDVSGIGQGVGAQNVAPYLGQIKSLQGQHEGNLAQLGTAEAQGRLDVQNQKYGALQGVLGNLRTSAKNKYGVEQDAYNAGQDAIQQEAKLSLESAKLPDGAIDKAKILLEQQKKGRAYITNPKALTAAIKQYGKDAIIDIGGRKFLLSAQEREALTNAKLSQQTKLKTINKTTNPKPPKDPKAPTVSRTKNSAKGYTFTAKNKDGTSTPITPYEYAKSKGLKLDDVLAGSEDPGDAEIVSLIQQARASGDSEDTIINDLLNSRYSHLIQQ